MEVKSGKNLGRAISLLVILSIATWISGGVNDWVGLSGKADAGPRGKVNINTASKNELLRKIPGITPAKAKRIIQGRPYNSIYDLVTKKILTKKELSRARENISTHDP